ncbi:hypothetical protein ONZ51_g1583 [Trametes cubensis]|uniref:RING-CH-type domain-containing protein n=1 Tax=Trametes cubensis TaxID=1111947 RepID=A0AAD7U3U4_9APHY|nr:hypothetical protein ONZ51_g1583 [Trametes cubensis]
MRAIRTPRGRMSPESAHKHTPGPRADSRGVYVIAGRAQPHPLPLSLGFAHELHALMSDEPEGSKQCRICLDGEDPELGRLIRPCLCKGTISYVHVKCLQKWRNTAASKSAFYACPQCGYHYHFARTRIVGVATNPVVIAALSTFLFSIIVLMSSFVATWYIGDADDDYYYWSTFYYPLDIFRNLVRMTIGFFEDGLLEDSTVIRTSRKLRQPRGPPSFATRLLRRFLLGIPVVGAGSIVHMLASIPMPFYTMRVRARRIGRQSRDLMALVVLALVIAGAFRALYKVYQFTERMAKRLLLRAEDAILEQSIRETISRPDFDAALPPLSDQTWMRILNYTPQTNAENERLEFLGDALMYATIGRQLYSQIPNGSPHLYTCVRAALHSNKTFAMLAEKLDIMAVSSTVLKALTRKTFGEGTAAPSKSRPQIKATADLFETVIGAYYLDHGFEALYEWVKEIYTPLINATVHTFRTGKTRSPKEPHQDPRTSKKGGKHGVKKLKERLLLTPVQQRKRALQKIQAAHAARHSPSPKISIIGSPNSTFSLAIVGLKVAYEYPLPVPAKPLLVPAAIPSRLSVAASTSKVPIQPAPVVKKAPIFIDLTLESDPEDESEQPTIFRHPLVTPRITRPSSAVSKRSTPARAIAAAAIPAVDTGVESNSEWEDETMLENMLTAEDSFSDMDCGSSDVGTPARPSNLSPFLTGVGLDGSPLDTGRPPLPRRSLFLMR